MTFVHMNISGSQSGVIRQKDIYLMYKILKSTKHMLSVLCLYYLFMLIKYVKKIKSRISTFYIYIYIAEEGKEHE